MLKGNLMLLNGITEKRLSYQLKIMLITSSAATVYDWESKRAKLVILFFF